MRIGTRGSALALAQTHLVTGLIGAAGSGADPDDPLEIVVVDASGDRFQVAKRAGGDKSRWVAELEHALLAGEIDLAVHSAKDVPGEIVDGLELLGAVARAAAEDALIGASSLEQLPQGACVGTSSLRRAAQLRAAREDLEVVSLRGNVDTRLRKLADKLAARGEGPASAQRTLDAIVLAVAGLSRLGREGDIGCVLDAARFVPAPGQGTIALQARAGDESARATIESILDKEASACLTAERAVAHALGASCNTPLGAHAVPAGCGCLNLRAWVGLPDGSEWVGDELLGGFYDPQELGRRVAERLEAVGARELLGRAEKVAG
jgi:hydroxymethylbilane synthase